MPDSLFNKVGGLTPEFCEISKNIFFYKTPLVAVFTLTWFIYMTLK